MKLNFFQEPQLEFGQSIHVCPRKGISEYQAYDIKFSSRKTEILIGIIGTTECVEKFVAWINKCRGFIPSKANNKQPHLFPPFEGFNPDSGFKAEFKIDKETTKTISNKEINDLIGIPNWDKRLSECSDLFNQQINYLVMEKGVDTVVCIIPKKLEPHITKQTLRPVEETIEGSEQEDKDLETDFRRLLKAKAMSVGKPIQLILQDSLEPYKEKSSRQDDATRAWNFCTALYYKTNHTPWRLIKDPHKLTTCYIGISFYRSRDRQHIHTSLAQLFDDLGNGVILRGSPVEISEEDRQPHLKTSQAYTLIEDVLKEYEGIHKSSPARVVIHKTSNFDEGEKEGFTQALRNLRINTADYITILDGGIRLFRNGLYPPSRGTHIELDKNTHLLFTKGSIEYYQTYPGLYIPRPLEIRISESDESPTVICEEILGLTKMNWNNTQFDGKFPITIGCARKVGLIMKYIPLNSKPQTKYSFYM